jgi:hypothetical protein
VNQIFELSRVDREVFGYDAVSVENRRQLAGRA